MTYKEDDKFSEQSRLLLDQHSEGLDAATLSRLHQARNKAIEGKSSNWISWGFGGAIAASVFLGVLVLYRPIVPLPGIYEDPLQQAVAEEIDLLNDLEFVAWLIIEEGENGKFSDELSST